MKEKFSLGNLLKIADELKIQQLQSAIHVVDGDWPHDILRVYGENKEYFILKLTDFDKLDVMIKSQSLLYEKPDPNKANRWEFFNGVPIHFVRPDEAIKLISDCLKSHMEKYGVADIPAQIIYKTECPAPESKGLHWWNYRRNATSYCNFCKAEKPVEKEKK